MNKSSLWLIEKQKELQEAKLYVSERKIEGLERICFFSVFIICVLFVSVINVSKIANKYHLENIYYKNVINNIKIKK